MRTLCAVLIVVGSAGLIGCTRDFSAAKSLADSGAAAGQAGAALMAVPESNTALLFASRNLITAVPGPQKKAAGKQCNQMAVADLSPEAKGSIKKVQQGFKLRRMAFADLEAAYQQFGEIAKYDFGGEMNGALDSTIGSVNALAAHWGKSGIDGTAKALVIKGGSLIADEIKDKMLKESSAEFRKILAKLYETMESERDVYMSVKGEQERNGHYVAEALFCAGYLDAREYLDEVGKPYGLTAVRPRMGQGYGDSMVQPISAAIRNRSEALVRAADASYGVTLDALRELQKEHKKFEDGQPMNLAQIRKMIAEMRAVVEGLPH